MKLEKTTIGIIIAVFLGISGIVGYNHMNKKPMVESIDTNPNKNDTKIYVHVKGEVINPGLYEMKLGDRINDAVKKAGGVTEVGDENRINLAKELTDGMEVIVPNINDELENLQGKININTASEERLTDIAGVGKATAKKIIKYREETGGFTAIEEIMNIDGIGIKTFETIKEDISIN